MSNRNNFSNAPHNNDKFAHANDGFADINRDFAHNNNAPHNNDGFNSDGLARDIGILGGGAPYPDMPPLQFVHETLGDKPYDKQEEILRAVEQAANASDGIRRVSVVGCNGSGKDWVAARVILWWMNTRDPAKVVITGPTTRQVTDIVWRELRTAYKNSAKPLRGTVRRAVLYEIDDESFAKGFASNSPFNLQGYHSPNMLVVVTEAHAVKDAYMDAVLRQNPALILMVGNPSCADGVFYDSHHSKREQYHAIQISAHDTPNIQEGRIVIPGMITQLDIDDRKLDWGEDSDSYINSVLGEFTENPDSVVVPLSVAREAAERHIEPEGEVIVACDVARGGNDKTVVVKRQGGNAEIVHSQRGNDLDGSNRRQALLRRKPRGHADSGRRGHRRRRSRPTARAGRSPRRAANPVQRRRPSQRCRTLLQPRRRSVVGDARALHGRQHKRPRQRSAHRAGSRPQIHHQQQRPHPAAAQTQPAQFARRSRRLSNDLRRHAGVQKRRPRHHPRLHDLGLANPRAYHLACGKRFNAKSQRRRGAKGWRLFGVHLAQVDAAGYGVGD